MPYGRKVVKYVISNKYTTLFPENSFQLPATSHQGGFLLICQENIMKKFLLISFIMLTACKSISYNDVNPEIKPNSNLLPALITVVDMNNLESVYSSGGYQGIANNYGTGYGANPWAGWAQTTVVNGTSYKDARVNDVINIFEKEVKENISSPYGEKKGYVALKLGYRGKDTSIFYILPSMLSLFTINILGFPANEITQSLEVQVEIWNNKKELIAKYTENVVNSDFIAMYWGYNETNIWRKVAADNIKQALEKIRYKINEDALTIKKKLK